jgi:hypothetical protein
MALYLKWAELQNSLGVEGIHLKSYSLVSNALAIKIDDLDSLAESSYDDKEIEISG